LITVDGKTLDCQGKINSEKLEFTINGYRSSAVISHFNNQISLYRQQGVFNFTHVLPDCGTHDINDEHGGLTAPMNGTMISVLVKVGDHVEKDQPLVIMEAMKMEHTIRAPQDGYIEAIYFNEGEMVDGGAELLAFTADEEKA